jgi:hypothetical protein
MYKIRKVGASVLLNAVRCQTEPMARMPKVARRKISLARGIHCCPKFFISFAIQRLYIVNSLYIQYTNISDYIPTVYELPLLKYHCDWNIFTQTRSGASGYRMFVIRASAWRWLAAG